MSTAVFVAVWTLWAPSWLQLMTTGRCASLADVIAPASGRKIVWLASYPKSGNTWFRILLSNYLSNDAQPISINTLGNTGYLQSIASARHLLSDTLGLDSSDFSEDDCEDLRPDVYRAIASKATRTPYMKVHDANVPTPSGAPLIPPDATALAVYLVRNPLDVVGSFAHHSGISVDQAIARMSDPSCAFCMNSRGLPIQLRQRLLTWSQHVVSWTQGQAFPVHVIRYEDLLLDPSREFGKAVVALNLPLDTCRISRAIEFSSFERLQKQEADLGGFREAPLKVDQFFRAGRAGTWRKSLTDAQVTRVIDAHGEVMRRFGYFQEAGQAAG